ncbi:hypothetical protein AB1Y20_013738 [Prymnesium parvum]|uniref:Uncharacterized protein n=1 Tax=Prymnesium parvum TaxID=97485 RepID=A0AB34IJH6_PRYPA
MEGAELVAVETEVAATAQGGMVAQSAGAEDTQERLQEFQVVGQDMVVMVIAENVDLGKVVGPAGVAAEEEHAVVAEEQLECQRG